MRIHSTGFGTEGFLTSRSANIRREHVQLKKIMGKSTTNSRLIYGTSPTCGSSAAIISVHRLFRLCRKRLLIDLLKGLRMSFGICRGIEEKKRREIAILRTEYLRRVCFGGASIPVVRNRWLSFSRVIGILRKRFLFHKIIWLCQCNIRVLRSSRMAASNNS